MKYSKGSYPDITHKYEEKLIKYIPQFTADEEIGNKLVFRISGYEIEVPDFKTQTFFKHNPFDFYIAAGTIEHQYRPAYTYNIYEEGEPEDYFDKFTIRTTEISAEEYAQNTPSRKGKEVAR